MRVEIVREAATPEPELPEGMEAHHIDATTGDDEFGQSPLELAAGVVAPEDRDPEDESTWGKVGRNEACPCGSGKKYKHCHGAF